MKPITIMIADDHNFVRKGIANLINTFDGMCVIDDADNGEELIKKVKKQAPDVILLDIKMPVMDGFQTMKHLYKHHPECKVIAISMYDDDHAFMV